jgi:amino acid adenylation domain-containing protein/non-ribosomal peptide synthase protein (TIGR01720 family)
MWTAQTLRTDSDMYNVDHYLWLRGELDLPALRSAFTEVLRRHEALRTVFPDTDPPGQAVQPAGPFKIGVIDLTSLRQDARSDEALRIAQAEASRPFDLATGPLFRVVLVKTGSAEHLMLVNVHHLLADEWALGLLANEVSALYAAQLTGTAPVLPELAIQYADFTHWQIERATTEVTERQRAYWRRTLADVPGVLELPTDHARPARPSGRGHRAQASMNAELSTSLRRLATGHGVTVFTALVGLLAIVLGRHAGQQRFAIGTAVSGRTRSETEPLIGLFVNTVAIPVDVAGGVSITDLLHETGRCVLGAFDHQDVSFEQVVAELNTARTMSRNPIFQVLVHWAESGQGWALPGLVTEPVTLSYGSAKVDLTLLAEERGDTIDLELVAEADLFEAGTARRLLDHFVNTVRQVTADPAITVGQVTLASPAELDLVTREWAGSVGDYPADRTVPEMFEAAVARTPDAVALVADDATLTYAQLDAAANQFAQLLHERGVGLESRVGVALPRSAGLVVALLGILKAGGAYIALDPANPPARNALLIADSAPQVIVTTTRLWPDLAAAVGDVRLVLVDDPATQAQLAAQSAQPPAGRATPLSLAYISYTSGSTGTPKGVAVEHRNIIRLIHGPDYASYGQDETFALLAPVAFDASTMELWASLCNGAKLVVPPAGRLDVPDIAELLRKHRITTIFLTTALFHQIVEHDVTALAGVRQLLTGGDVLNPQAFTKPLHHHPNLTMVACYGPTENTTYTTAIAITDPNQITNRVPIGHPIPHSTVYILDENLQPVPIGTTGELYTGGHGIARGYLNQPARTAERFLPDPYQPGARMYRTGDLARWTTNGTLDFIGRTDNQVKIRGYRIELGEIETRLNQHPDITEAAVITHTDPTGHKTLTAYTTPRQPTNPPTPQQLKTFIQQTLPNYMTPHTFITLDHIPLNPNGKIDRKALPHPTQTTTTTNPPTNTTTTPTEQTLLTIWQKTLPTTTITIHDNFFDLGGDSILSIRIASEARRAGLPLSSSHLFDHQTIAELATAITTGETTAIPTAQQDTVTGVVPLTPIQHWFTQLDKTYDHYNQAVRLQWAPSPDPDLLHAALHAVVAHHDALRLRLTRNGGDWQQHIAETEPGQLLDVVDVLGLSEKDQETTIIEAATRAHTTLDLVGGPIARAVLFQGAVGGDQMIVVIHHIAIDTVSWEIVLDDLAAAYEQLSSRAEVRLPAKTTSFQRWADRLTQYASSDAFAAEAAFWRGHANAVAIPLPVDWPGGSNHVGGEAAVTSVLAPDYTDALLRNVPAAYRTQINDVLLTALARTLRGWTGAGVHRIDLEGHGRESPLDELDVSRTVGWFTSVYPVELRLPEEDDAGEALVAIRDQLRQIPRKGVGYGLAKYLTSAAGQEWIFPMNSPLSFNYHGQIDGNADRNPRRLAAPAGPEVDPSATRPYLFEVTAAVVEGSLRVSWTYPAACYARSTVQRLAGDFVEQLRTLIAHCRERVEGLALTSR